MAISSPTVPGAPVARPGSRRLGRAGGPVLRLCAELPGPAAAVDPGQADPGRAGRDRRPAGPADRAVFRDVLLHPGHSGGMAGGPDEPGEGAGHLLRPVERGHRRLRPGRQLSATGRRAHGRGRGRGGRRAAILRHHLGLFPTGHAGHGAQPVQHGPAHRHGAGGGLRRLHRRGLFLAAGVPVGRRHRGSDRPDRLVHGARAQARGTGRQAGRRSGSGRGAGGCPCPVGILGDLPHVLRGPGAVPHRGGLRRHPVHHLCGAQLHRPVPDAREGHGRWGRWPCGMRC